MKGYKVVRKGNVIHIFSPSGFLYRFDPTGFSDKKIDAVLEEAKKTLHRYEYAYAKVKLTFKCENGRE